MQTDIHSRESGFTLVEVIVTATFIATVVASIIQIFIVIGIAARQARHLSVATQLAQEKVEYYRNTGYNAIALGSPAQDFSSSLPADFGSTKSATATVTEEEPGLKRVVISISYKEGQKPKEIKVSTFITERGINR